MKILKQVNSYRNSRGHIRHNCLYLCDCGKEFIADRGNVNSGNTRSCGCLAKDNLSITYKQGLSYKYLWRIWYDMIRRCYNENRHNFKYYGGRGIKVYYEWIDNPEKFINWIIKNLGERPSKEYTLDRIENNGHYEPGNLRWATKLEQRLNRRK